LSPNLENAPGGRFLFEALPLVATYFSGETVELAGTAIPFGEESDAETIRFAAQLRLRHALACCATLLPIVQRIEEHTSYVNRMIRTETQGVIRGRLDIPRYVARKATSLSWPRTYPILVSEDSPSTPENALTGRVLRILLARLATKDLDSQTAEVTAARRFRHWISNRLSRSPWCEVRASSSIARLQLEASRRVDRRQTGNDRAYSELIGLVKQWKLNSGEIGGSPSSEEFVNTLLSFPADDFFLDRIYEIWCIREIAACLLEIGATLVDGPIALTNNRASPIYTFQLDKARIEIWFQRSLDTRFATWRYELNGQLLRGIPDITVIANGAHFLLVDAKNRLVTGNTRPEETYKMLGYFENFKTLLGKPASWGILAFISYNRFSQSLASFPDRKLVMLSANPTSAQECTFKTQMTSILYEWVSNWPNVTE
jgi:hypothetical protein